MSNRQVSTVQSSMISWSPEEVQVVKETVARGANLSDAEFKMFAHVCRELGADVFKKHIYAIRYQQNAPPTFQVAIDFYRAKAHATGKLKGMIGPEWCGEDGEWKDVWLDSKPPMAARFGVVHADTGLVWASAMFAEYNQNNSMWKQRPAGQIGKCAEALAYRRAFPDQLGGVYTHDEMQANPETGEIIDSTATQVAPPQVADERFGANKATIDQLLQGARDALQSIGGELKYVQKLPDWPGGGSIKAGLAEWARQRPEEDVVATLKANLAAVFKPEAPTEAAPAAAAQPSMIEG